MDRRERDALDNHITGHYGRDQFSAEYEELMRAIEMGLVDEADLTPEQIAILESN